MRRLFHHLAVLRRSHWLLMLAILALMIVGILFVRSATHMRTDSMRYLYKTQIFWALAGWAVFFAVSLFDYRKLTEWVWFYYACALALLVMVLAVGKVMYGSRRWLNFFGMTFQPSELAKLATLMLLAWVLSRPGLDLRRWRTVLLALGLTALPMGLIVVQPDLGTSLVFLPIAGAMLFAAGASLRHLGVLVLAGALAAALVLGTVLVPRWMGLDEERQKEVFTRVTGLKTYQWKRIMVFVDPDADRLGAGYNSWQSRITIGSGGWDGKGYRQGAQSSLGYLPRTVSPTDFIFAVIGEEAGFVGCAAVLGLFGTLVLCGMAAAARARDRLGRLICTGVTALMFTHVFVNIAMTIGLMPVKGLPLPLVSYGGSFMLCMMASLGLVQNVYCRRI